MKKLIIAGLFVCLVGCHRMPDVMRTGSVCVKQPNSSNYQTNDFIDVKADLADRIALEMSKETKRYIGRDSQLQITECGESDYEIFIIFTKINTEIQQTQEMFSNSWTAKKISKRKYTIDIDYELKSKGSLVMSHGIDSSGTDISKVIESLSEKLVDEIKKIKSK